MIYINSSYSSIEFCDRNGKLHRVDGPAVTDAIYVEYWIDHVQYAYHIYIY